MIFNNICSLPAFLMSFENLIYLYGIELTLVAMLYLVIKFYLVLSKVSTVCALAGELMLTS